MELIEIVKKLTGKINPEAISEIDAERLENLKIYCELFEEMHTELFDILWNNRNRTECSIKKSTEYIKNCFKELRIEIE